jgi:hypothetical protein
LCAFVNGMVYGVCCMLTNTSEGVLRGAGHCTVDGPQKWTNSQVDFTRTEEGDSEGQCDLVLPKV